MPRKSWVLVLTCLAALGPVAWLIHSMSLARRDSEEQSAIETRYTPVDQTTYRRIASYADSGYSHFQNYVMPIKDRRSLHHVRDCYQGAGFRGAASLEKELATGSLLPQYRLELLQATAQLYMYEGEFQKASEVLGQARELIESDPARLKPDLPALLFLQGMASLRRGEIENCVDCGCESSCIFPLMPRAYHQKPEGSRAAVRYFTEYLAIFSDDVGVMWLLNLAYMTLGEYPAHVPTRYLIPLNHFESGADIGRFVDIAATVGLNRLDMAGGAIMDDFDNDGMLDIVESTSDETGPMRFYRNRGDGTFQDRSKPAGLENQLGGLYCVQTDYNNDGFLDVFVPRGAWKEPVRPSLLRNNGNGTFTDVTKEAGLDEPVASQVAVWADFDNDGFLDLFVGSELYSLNGQPQPSRSYLYRNLGNGRFEEIGRKAGVSNEGFLCKGANWGDFDNDNYPDLFVSNLSGPCRLFHNNHDGTFTDVALQMGVTRPHTGFSCWFFDYDNDGWLDLFVASFDRTLPDIVNSYLGRPFKVQTSRLYHNLQGKRFEDVTRQAGLDLAMAPMGSNFADFDNDGYLDFYLATGDPNYSTLVPNRMFRNMKGVRFADITTSSGTGHLQKGHAVACGDWDRDGNIDMFVQMGGATPGDRANNLLFQNPGHPHHWITIRLSGKKSNRAAIGARVTIYLDEGDPRKIVRTVSNGSSFGANPLLQTIGLGKARKISRLEVYWPTTKSTQTFTNVQVDRAIAITELEPDYQSLQWNRIPAPQVGISTAGR